MNAIEMISACMTNQSDDGVCLSYTIAWVENLSVETGDGAFPIMSLKAAYAFKVDVNAERR